MYGRKVLLEQSSHLDRICAEKDFSTVDDPVKELRKLQNDPSLIRTNSLNTISCHWKTLQYLFEIITYYVNALCALDPAASSPSIRSPMLGRSPVPQNVKSPPTMPQIEENSNTAVDTQNIEESTKSNQLLQANTASTESNSNEFEHESVTYAYFILSCLRLLRCKVRIAAHLFKENKPQFDTTVGPFDFNLLQKSLLQFMGENTDNMTVSFYAVDRRVHRLIQYEATALLSAGIELFYPSHSTRIALVNTLLDGSASSIFTQALLAQFSQPALLQGFLPAMVLIEDPAAKRKAIQDAKSRGDRAESSSISSRGDTTGIITTEHMHHGGDDGKEQEQKQKEDVHLDSNHSLKSTTNPNVNDKKKEQKKGDENNKDSGDDLIEYKIDAAKLLDLLTILMERSHLETLKMFRMEEEDGHQSKSSGLSATTAFLSCLQRESLIWITQRLTNNVFVEQQWIDILGEHAKELCTKSIDLCSKMTTDPLLIRHLKYSIVGSILPSFLFALGCMDFMDKIPEFSTQLTTLLTQLDAIHKSYASNTELLADNQWLITLENIVASFICKRLSKTLVIAPNNNNGIGNEKDGEKGMSSKSTIDYMSLLNSPLLCSGIRPRSVSLLSDDDMLMMKKRAIDERRSPKLQSLEMQTESLGTKQDDENQRQFVRDLINGEREAKVLCNWLHSNSKHNRIIPKIDEELDTVIRTAFVAYLYLNGRIYEALVYAVLIKSKGLPRSEIDIAPPPELIVLWEQSLKVGQSAWIQKRSLVQEWSVEEEAATSLMTDDDEEERDKIKKHNNGRKELQEGMIKELLSGYQERAQFLMRVMIEEEKCQTALGAVSKLFKMGSMGSLKVQQQRDEEEAVIGITGKLHVGSTSPVPSEHDTSGRNVTTFVTAKAMEPARSAVVSSSPTTKSTKSNSSKWKVLRTTLRVLSHWKSLSAEREKAPISNVERGYYRRIKDFICKKKLKLSVIEDMIRSRDESARARYEGLREIRGLLTSLSCPSVKQEILKSLFILYHTLHPDPNEASSSSSPSSKNSKSLQMTQLIPRSSSSGRSYIIPPILKGLQSATPSTMDQISDLFHCILKDSTSILSDTTASTTLRASVLGIWAMRIGTDSNSMNNLLSETDIFSTLSDILSQRNRRNNDNNASNGGNDDSFHCNDSLRMFIWSFYCLLLEQVMSSKKEGEFQCAINVLQQQIIHYQETISEEDWNESFPESIVLLHHGELDQSHHGFKFQFDRDLVSLYISQHGYIPDELRIGGGFHKSSSSPKSKSFKTLPAESPSALKTPSARNKKKEVIVKPARYSGFREINDLRYYSIGFWLKIHSTDSSNPMQMILLRGTHSSPKNVNPIVYLCKSDLRVHVDISQSGGIERLQSNTTLLLREWTHILLIVRPDGESMKKSLIELYINGTLDTQKQTANPIRGGLVQSQPLFVGGVPQNDFKDTCNRGGAHCAVMDLTMFLYPICRQNQVMDFYQFSLKQCSHFVSRSNFEIALDILKSHTVSSLNPNPSESDHSDSILIRRWLPIWEILDALLGILQSLRDDARGNSSTLNVVSSVLGHVEWILLLCSPDEIESMMNGVNERDHNNNNTTGSSPRGDSQQQQERTRKRKGRLGNMESMAQLIDFLLDIAEDALSSNSTWNKWYDRCKEGDRAILCLRKLLRDEAWSRVIGPRIEKYMDQFAVDTLKYDTMELQNLLMALSVFGGNDMYFHRDLSICFASHKAKNVDIVDSTCDGVVREYAPNMLTARFIPNKVVREGERHNLLHQCESRPLMELVPVVNGDSLPHLNAHYDVMVEPLTDILISFKDAMQEWMDPKSGSNMNANLEKKDDDDSEETEEDELDLLKSVQHILTLTIASCKPPVHISDMVSFEPHPKFPIPDAVEARLVLEAKQKEEAQRKWRELEAKNKEAIAQFTLPVKAPIPVKAPVPAPIPAPIPTGAPIPFRELAPPPLLPTAVPPIPSAFVSPLGSAPIPLPPAPIPPARAPMFVSPPSGATSIEALIGFGVVGPAPAPAPIPSGVLSSAPIPAPIPVIAFKADSPPKTPEPVATSPNSAIASIQKEIDEYEAVLDENAEILELLRSASETLSDDKPDPILERPLIDYSDINELGLMSSTMILKILRVLRLFSDSSIESGDSDSLMSSISSNKELMKSLLFFASLPIKFDTRGHWVEIEQIQTQIGVSIECYRMEQWIKTHDFFQHQMSLHEEYLSNVENYTMWLKTEKEKLIRKEEERKRKEEEEERKRREKEEEERKRKEEEEKENELKQPDLSPVPSSDTALPSSVPFGRGSIISKQIGAVSFDGDVLGPVIEVEAEDEKNVFDEKENVNDDTVNAVGDVDPVTVSTGNGNENGNGTGNGVPTTLTVTFEEKDEDAKEEKEATHFGDALAVPSGDEIAEYQDAFSNNSESPPPAAVNSTETTSEFNALSMSSNPATLTHIDDQSMSVADMDLNADLTAEQQAQVTLLISMGFSPMLSRRCLEVTGYNIQNAVELMANSGISSDFNLSDIARTPPVDPNAPKPQLVPDNATGLPVVDMTGFQMDPMYQYASNCSSAPNSVVNDADSAHSGPMGIPGGGPVHFSPPSYNYVGSVSPAPPLMTEKVNVAKLTKEEVLKMISPQEPETETIFLSATGSPPAPVTASPYPPPSIKLEDVAQDESVKGPSPPPKPKTLQFLKLGASPISLSERRKLNEQANDAKKKLIQLMSTLPKVEDASIPDATTNETAVTPFNLAYFSRGGPNVGFAFIRNLPQNLKKLFDESCTHNLKFALVSLLKLQTLINFGLSIHYSRQIVQATFSRWMDQTLWNSTDDIKFIMRSTQRQISLGSLEMEQLGDAQNEEEKDDRKEKENESFMSLLDTEEISDFYRFLKLYVFRNTPIEEQSQRRLLQLLISNGAPKLRTQLIDGAIIELRIAAQETTKYNDRQWGFRPLINSDENILKEPRVELSLAILNEAVRSKSDDDDIDENENDFESTKSTESIGITLEQFVSMNVCLRTANMPLKCHLFGIITKLLLSLPFDDVDTLSEWIGKLPVRGLEQLAQARYKKETADTPMPPSALPYGGASGYFSQFTAASKSAQSQRVGQRLLKSQYLTQLMELVVVAKLIEERVQKLKYREKVLKAMASLNGMDDVNIFVVDTTSTSICIGWNTKKEDNKIWPNCYILQMRKSSKSSWKTLMKGNGRQWLVNKGLKPRKKYYFRMQAIHIGDDSKNVIRGEWTNPVTVTTMPDLTWNPNKKGRATVEFQNGNTRAILQSGGDRWRTVTANKGFNSGKNSWTIKVLKTHRMFIFLGVVTGSVNIDTFCGGDQYGYGFFLQDRYRYHNRGKISADRVAPSHEFKKDDEITLTLDFNEQALRVAVNGTNHGELFCGVFDTAELWYPAVSLYHKNDGVEFVDKSSSSKQSQSLSNVLEAETKKMEAFEQTMINFKDTFLLSRALCGYGQLPQNILSVAFCEWKSWFSHTVRAVKTMHSTLFIDVDDEKCQSVMGGYVPNDMVEEAKSFGIFKLLGLVRKDDSLVLKETNANFKEFYYLKEGAREIEKGSIEMFIKEIEAEREKKKKEMEEEEEETKEDDGDDNEENEESVAVEVEEEENDRNVVGGNEEDALSPLSQQSPISQARSLEVNDDDDDAESPNVEAKEEKDEDQKEEKTQPDSETVDAEEESETAEVDGNNAESKNDGDKEEKENDVAAAPPPQSGSGDANSVEVAPIPNGAPIPDPVPPISAGAATKKEDEDKEKSKSVQFSSNKKTKKEIEKEAAESKESEQKESRIFSKEEEREMAAFFDCVSNDTIWTVQKDAALLRAVGQVALSKDLHIWSLLSTDLKNCNILKMASELENDSRITFKSATQRFVLLMLFNRALSFVLPFISFDLKYAMNARLGPESNADVERGTIYNYGAQICRYLYLMKPLIFSDLKNNLLSQVISLTNTPTALNEDPYEDPPSLKKVTINRHKARKAKELYSKRGGDGGDGDDDDDKKTDLDALLVRDKLLKNSIFHQLLVQLRYLDHKDLRRNYAAKLDDGQERTFKVKFFGEGVTDNGGPYRETFHELIDEVFDEEQILPLFIKCPNFQHSDGVIQDKFVPNPSCSEKHLFEFFGQIIGICVRNHILINFNLSSIVWKQLLGPQLNGITLDGDIAEIDEGFVRRYKFVQNVDLTPKAAATDLSFVNFAFKRCDGSEVELIPNGKNVFLTQQNRDNYLKLMLFHKIHEFDDQIAAIRRGFSQIVPLHLLPIYTHSELEHVVCGDSDFSVDLLKAMTVYEGGLSASSRHVLMFWSMLRTLTPTEKEMFLRFTWAKTRMPSKKSQFKGNTFKLQPYNSGDDGNQESVDQLLPTAHTCFFSLQLPAYSTVEIMKQRFLYAFNNTASMDRDMKLQDSELYNYEKDEI